MASLRVFLDPEVFKVRSKTKLKLLLDGQAQAHVLRPSLEVVAESWARARDPELLYSCAVTLEIEGGGGDGGRDALGDLKDLRDAWNGGKKN